MNESVLFASEEKVVQHGCHDCASRKMYACAQGRKAYPNGGPDTCPPQKKTPGWRSCNEAQRSEESEFIAALLAENIRLKAELQERRDRIYDDMLLWRGIDRLAGEEPCTECGGSGIRVYGSTATWRGGIGGQAITHDVCDRCWGSGRADKPWTNLRKKQMIRLGEEIEYNQIG